MGCGGWAVADDDGDYIVDSHAVSPGPRVHMPPLACLSSTEAV